LTFALPAFIQRGLHGPSSFFYLEPPSTDLPGGELDEAHAADNTDRLQATIDSEYSSTMEWLGFLNVNSFMPEYRAGASTFGVMGE
jgi:hypothetical protein